MQSGITCKTSKPKLRVGDERALSKGEDGSHKQPRCGKWSHMPKPAKVRREDELSEQLKTRRWLPRTATTQVECCRERSVRYNIEDTTCRSLHCYASTGQPGHLSRNVQTSRRAYWSCKRHAKPGLVSIKKQQGKNNTKTYKTQDW